MLPLLGEARVKLAVSIKCRGRTDFVVCAQVADTCLEKILFDGPAHEVVVNGRLCDFFVEGDSVVVVLAFESNEIGRLEPELIGQCLCGKWVNKNTW